jgi:hypothetical protein
MNFLIDLFCAFRFENCYTNTSASFIEEDVNNTSFKKITLKNVRLTNRNQYFGKNGYHLDIVGAANNGHRSYFIDLSYTLTGRNMGRLGSSFYHRVAGGSLPVTKAYGNSDGDPLFRSEMKGGHLYSDADYSCDEYIQA